MNEPAKFGMLNGRRLEFFSHGTEPAWGYEKDQTDTFAILYPKDYDENRSYPLEAVFHSAGHDVYSTLVCIMGEHNHDIYHVPDGMFGYFPDCRANMNDWWWGGDTHHEAGQTKNRTTEPSPVEKRVLSELGWVLDNYPIDRDAVYAVGNSMGGSGALGTCVCRGDIFAAVKANVPAGVRHCIDRCGLSGNAPEGFTIPDPPVVIDYSGQNDGWSGEHELLYAAMKKARYALIGFWGAYGHANNDLVIEEKNDLVHSLDIATIRRNAAYPVFTNASSDDEIPWPDHCDSPDSGQVNAFFRWRVIEDTASRFSIEIRLMNKDDWQTRVTLPESVTADLLLRRLQNFKPAAGEVLTGLYGSDSVTAVCDPTGHPSIDGITVTQEPKVLTFTK